jgi:hypothetical protein
MQKLTGTIREVRYQDAYPNIKIDAQGKTVTIVLAPKPRMDFRNLTDEMLRVGVSVGVEAYPSKTIPDEFRAITLTIGNRATELR